MRTAICGFLFTLAAFAADDGWTKVRELKSGTEVRVYSRGSRQALNARLDDAMDDKIVISVKNEQRAMEKDEIDRLDARPSNKGGSRITRETKTTTTNPATEPKIEGVPSRPNIPGQSQSSGVSFGSGKPDFETVYRRAAMPSTPAAK